MLGLYPVQVSSEQFASVVENLESLNQIDTGKMIFVTGNHSELGLLSAVNADEGNSIVCVGSFASLARLKQMLNS